MSYVWITLEIIVGLILGIFSAGYMLEQIFSVLNGGKDGRWGMLLAGVLVVGGMLAAAFYYELDAGLWSALGSTGLLLAIVVYQNIKYGRLADEFRANHPD